MYGKPEWFQLNSGRWFMRPNSWQGWAYAVAWVAAMMLPTLALAGRHQEPEALVWMLLSSGLWLWDAVSIRKAGQPQPAKEVFYIGDEAEQVV